MSTIFPMVANLELLIKFTSLPVIVLSLKRTAIPNQKAICRNIMSEVIFKRQCSEDEEADSKSQKQKSRNFKRPKSAPFPNYEELFEKLKVKYNYKKLLMLNDDG